MKTDFHKLQNDGKTRSELMENIEITTTTYQDGEEIIRITRDTFGISSDKQAFMQLVLSQADLDNSVKLIDKRDGKIYGILIFSLYPITVGTPILFTKYRILGEYINKYSHVNGYAFVIDERLRGTNLDKEMLSYKNDYLEQFEFVWCAVDKDLKTHEYWKHIGFTELFDIDEAIFYIKRTHGKTMEDIFILKALVQNEKNCY